jgi:hypothetical protein
MHVPSLAFTSMSPLTSSESKNHYAYAQLPAPYPQIKSVVIIPFDVSRLIIICTWIYGNHVVY